MAEIRKILVPTDFSDHSLQALPHARHVAKAFGAELILFHALPDPLYPFAVGSTSLPELREQLRLGCSQRLKDLVEAETDVGLAARPLLGQGTPSLEILAAADDEQVDLIVLATHGHTGLDRALLGSTAEKVLRKARCPVLIVPPKGVG